MLVSAAEAHAGSLSMEAHETGTGDGTYTNWATDWGSYDRDFHRQKHILIAVRDFSRSQKSPVTVHVYFIAHPQGKSQPLFVYGYTAQHVEFHGELEIRGDLSAPRLDANTQNYAALGETYHSGADIDGWIVVGEADGHAFQTRASRQGLLDLATQHPEDLETMKKDYEHEHSSKKH